MKLLIAGGGTGGHINPAIAIANEFSNTYKDSEILFVGTRSGLESELVPKAGYDIKFINVEGFLRIKSFYNLIVAGKFATSLLKCIAIIKKFKPDIVVGTGGYVSAPVVLAANYLKIPTLIHEQNALAGKTTKMLSKYVNKICVAFNDKNVTVYPEKTVVTGNPVRASFKNADALKAKKELSLDNGLKTVLCVSGSLGAQKISEYMTDYIKNNYRDIKYNLIVVTGDLYYEDVMNALKEAYINLDGTNIQIKNYIYDMEKYLAAADLVISRSGAIFLSEIAYLGKPSVLIPSPNVAENHQEINADRYVNMKAAVKIKENELSKDILKETIEGLIYDEKKLTMMSLNAKKMSVDDSAAIILKEIKKILDK